MPEGKLPVPMGSAERRQPEASKEASGDSQDTRKCPFCKEQIFSDAIKCKHCGSVLAPISDNFANANTGSGYGNNVQIVTNTPPAETSRKSSDYIINPPAGANSMLGHGWGMLAVALVFAAMSGGGTGDEAVGAAMLGALIVVPWSIWVLSKSTSNKVLPAVSLIITTLVFIGAVTPAAP